VRTSHTAWWVVGLGRPDGAMGIGNGGQVQIERGGTVATGRVGQIKGDGARVGGQRVGLVLLALRVEHRKGRCENAPCAFGAPSVAVGSGLISKTRLQL